jgi:hypothetical protein
MWLCKLNIADGTLVEQPERIAADHVAPNGFNPFYPDIPAHDAGQVLTSNGFAAFDWSSGYPEFNLGGDANTILATPGRIYRGGSQATDELTGDAPSPGLPTNLRWESKVDPLDRGRYNASILVRNLTGGDPRYAATARVLNGSNGTEKQTFGRGVSAIPGTDDLIWAFSVATNGTDGVRAVRIDGDYQEQGSWLYDLPGLRGRNGGDVVRLNDSPGTPENPSVAWAMRFHKVGGSANEGSDLLTPPACDPASDAFVVVGSAHDIETTTRWERVAPSSIVIGPFSPYGSDTSGGTVISILGGKPSDGTPTWVQNVVSNPGKGQPGTTDILGSPVRMGREWAVPLHVQSFVRFDKDGPYELILTGLGEVRGWAYYDITSGEFKRWEPDPTTVSGGNGSTPHWIRSGYTDVRDDLPNESFTVGVPFTSTAPVVENVGAGVTLTFTNTGDALPAGLTMDPATGVVSGTATGSAIDKKIITRVDGSDGTWSYSNRWHLTSPATFTESFELAEGWPGIVANPFPTPTFATPTFTESFEAADLWPGTGLTAINISNTGSGLTDHQVLVSHPELNGLEVEFFSDIGLTTPIPFWREDANNWWVKTSLTANDTTIIYAAYGGAITGGPGNGASVFEFFEDFSSLAAWTATGDGAIVSGELVQGTGATHLNTPFGTTPVGFVFETRMSATFDAGQWGGFFTGDTPGTASSNTNGDAVNLMIHNASTSNLEIYAADGTVPGYNLISGVLLQATPSGTKRIYSHSHDGTNIRISINRAAPTSTYAGNWVAPVYMTFGYFLGATAGATDTTNLIVDWALVRKYTSNTIVVS